MPEINGYRCSVCRTVNPDEAKHCMNCGALLVSDAQRKKVKRSVNIILVFSLIALFLAIAFIHYVDNIPVKTAQQTLAKAPTPINCKELISKFQNAGMVFTNETGFNEPVIDGMMPEDPNMEVSISGDIDNNNPDFLDIHVVGLNSEHMLFVTSFANNALPGFDLPGLIDKTNKNYGNWTSTFYNGYTVKMFLPPYTNMLDLEISRNK